MIIDFNSIEETITPNFYGGEKNAVFKRFTDDLNRILMGRLEPGASIGFHKHEENSETIYVLHGKGTAVYDDTTESLQPGSCHYCPKGHSHSLVNDGAEDLIFFAVVPKH